MFVVLEGTGVNEAKGWTRGGLLTKLTFWFKLFIIGTFLLLPTAEDILVTNDELLANPEGDKPLAIEGDFWPEDLLGWLLPIVMDEDLFTEPEENCLLDCWVDCLEAEGLGFALFSSELKHFVLSEFKKYPSSHFSQEFKLGHFLQWLI